MDTMTICTSTLGLDALADHLAAEWQLSHADRDRLRAKLAALEGVVRHPQTGQLVRMIVHEQAGAWARVTLEPFQLRVLQ